MNTCKYVRNDIDDEYGILALQDKILEIMVYIDEVCRSNGITYYLMGGSALGAMRHGGFIPWDDDLDIFMDYENFHRFEQFCKTKLDTKRFFYQARDSYEMPHFFAKLRMNGTTYIEEGNKGRKMHQGIFVDIMCLINAAPEGWKRKMQYYEAAILKAKALTLTNYHSDSKKKVVAMMISKIFVRGLIKKWLIHEVHKYNDNLSDYQAHIFGRAKYQNSFYPTKDFGEPRYVAFEKIKLAVPSNVEEYLTLRYGVDYMQMPSQEIKTMYKSHPVKWDVNTDYKEILGCD